MAEELARFLEGTLEREFPALEALSELQARIPRGPGKWTPKEELGHLLDSAANNHIRFVRASLDGHFRGDGYDVDAWVRAHGYAEISWESLVSAWLQRNRLLVHLVERIPDDRLEAGCVVGGDPPVTLRFLISDYVLHMQHHIDQLLRRPIVTQYPGAAPVAARS